MSTVADKLAKKSSTKSSAKQVRLRLVYVDFWSALKLSFLAGIAVAVATVVSIFLIFTVIQQTTVLEEADKLIRSIAEDFSILPYVGMPQVMAFAGVAAILNLVVWTVMGAIIAGIYNLAVKVTGGLLVGFTSN